LSKFGFYKAINTIDTEIPHIDLPLAGLLTRLELGGFNLSPAEKVRLLQVISGPASVHWDEPQKLRYLLAPVIAHSKAEQERFYIIFDQYYAEILANATEADKAEAKGAWLKTLRTWLRKWWSTFPALLGLALLGYFIYPLLKPEPQTTSIGISHITPIRVGDTTVFTLNTKNIDTVDVNIHWSLTDKASGTIEAETDGLRTWQVPFTVLQGNPEKIITVDIHEKRRDSTFHFDSDLRIDCVNPPQLDGLGLPNNLPPGEDYTFTANVIEATPDLQYHWDFGDGDSSTLRTPTHRYVEKGSYNVELRVTRPGLSGFCTTSTYATMRVGEDQVNLPWYDLQYAPVRLTANYNWGLWVLIGLLAAAIFYSLFLWAKTQAPQTPEPPKRQPPGLPLQSPDRPPYEIPFRPLNGLIRNFAGQFRLADALRRRQEGQRQEVDVPKTVDVTIASGGFPRLQFRSSTKPADYLFLVDEQNETSHQGRLLRHLVKVLHDQDVHAEVFYYRSEFFHFWNAQYPQGITLEQVSRLCPEHRVIVFGDAHGLLDPFAQGNKVLRSEPVADLQRWKRRLLLSPRPPQSWDYREASLHAVLPVFPADLEGQMAAANFIDNGMEPDDLPSAFSTWRERLATTRTEPDVNRRWRSASDHAEYLGYGSDLYRWFCALALYPSPTWEITLAVGAALDIPLNADGLLVLARIPSLQEGKINPRLRKELLADLQLYDEELARTAIANELEASLAEAAPGFANRALQTNLAVQRFALTPSSPESKAQVKLLLDQGWFNRVHIEDLGGVAVRELAPMQRSRPATKGGFTKQARQTEETYEQSYEQNVSQSTSFEQPFYPLNADEPTLRRFLEENEEIPQQEIPEVEKPLKPPFINSAFWRLLAFFVAFLVVVFSLLLTDNDQLYRLAFGRDPGQQQFDPKAKLRSNFFVKEIPTIDSAVILNNEAVQLYIDKAFPEMEKNARGDSITVEHWPTVSQKLEQAQQYEEKNRSVLPQRTAALNLARLNYNRGVMYYKAWQGGTNLPEPMDLSIEQFRLNRDLADQYFTGSNIRAVEQEAFQGLALASKHAEGVVSFLINTTNDPSMAEGIHYELDTLGFFDTTRINPNLATLLQKDPSRVYDIFPGKATNLSLEVQVHYSINPTRDKGLRLRLVAVERTQANNNVQQGRNARTTRAPAFVAAQELPAQGRDGRTKFTLRSKLNRPGDLHRTDSLVAELIQINPNPNATKVVARLAVAHPQRWGLPPVNIPEPENTETTLSGRVLDDRSGEPIPQATMMYEWNTTSNNIPSDPGMSDARGAYTLRRDLRRITGLTIKVNKEGYQPAERNFNQAQLQRLSNGRFEDIRMVRLDQQTIDPRQSGQTTTNERTEYKPIVPEMVRVNAGTFMMGCEDKRDKDCQDNEKPAHEVTLSTYSIGKYEVTNAEYAVFLNDVTVNPNRVDNLDRYIEEHEWGLQKTTVNGQTRWQPAKGYEKYPVIRVNWDGAVAYCRWLSNKIGQQYRLPTEAEWEYAARGGEYGQKVRFQYAGSDRIDEVAWYEGNSKGTNPVGKKKANQLGIYDMSGNVYEWCQDGYGIYEGKAQMNPLGANTGSARVIRGGSWATVPIIARVAFRNFFKPDVQGNDIGFRLTLSSLQASGR